MSRSREYSLIAWTFLLGMGTAQLLQSYPLVITIISIAALLPIVIGNMKYSRK